MYGFGWRVCLLLPSGVLTRYFSGMKQRVHLFNRWLALAGLIGSGAFGFNASAADNSIAATVRQLRERAEVSRREPQIRSSRREEAHSDPSETSQSLLTSAATVRLEGEVWWANPAQGRFVLKDDSGAEALEVELSGDFPRAGQRVRLEGKGLVAPGGFALRLGAHGPVVDNNGIHAMIEKSGAVYLEAGRQPIRIEWFNGGEGLGLEVEYEGPELPRQKIPATALFPLSPAPPPEPDGLDVRYYEFTDNLLTDFSALPPLKTNVAARFTLDDLPRRERIAAVFTGLLDVPRRGVYTFHLKSDDGSRLFVGRPTFQVTALGTTSPPQPHRITVGQILSTDEDRSWVEVEGKVTLTRETFAGPQLELTAGAGHMRVEIGNATDFSAAGWLNARVRASGFCQSVRTADGQNVAGILLVPGSRELEMLEPPPGPSPTAVNATTSNALPVLTTAGAVHRLKREEAQRAYPVKIHGVVTCVLPEHQAFTIQDATRGIYVEDHSPQRASVPQVGEHLEVEGATDPSLFAPIIHARRVHSLGAGRPPEPVKPTWDQIINGSLDAQQVELQGIVTTVHSNGLTLLMRGGVVKIELRLAGSQTSARDRSPVAAQDNTDGLGNAQNHPTQRSAAGEGPPALREFENALVRIRGCLFASWDYVTHQVKMGDVRIYAADIFVEQPAPPDLFSSPRKTAGELLLFDPQAGVFQRVKVSGQIIHVRDAEYFLMDGARGLRFTPKQPAPLAVGDFVDVVGFPDLLGSASPVLREAVVRQTGRAPLPAPKTLTADNLIQADHDATRVRVEGVLVNLRRTKTGTVLEMQNGVRTFIAHLRDSDQSGPSFAPGSKLELTGTYAGLGGNRAAGQDIASFELWLQSSADLSVLARPPWWTLKRLLAMIGALAVVLAGAGLWITQLHRQVEERTTELGAQIQERQRIEHQRAMEQERARIAQDLHDELGSGITEMSMLAARAKSAAAPGEKRERHLDQVSSKARDLVTALDEIVWAMNPRHDSLASLVSYFSLYADRFLGLANIAWRLEGPTGSPDQAVDSRRRHQLFLAFKEALTNVVRHSAATEVRIGIRCEHDQIHISVADNGRGLPEATPAASMDGIHNMRARIEKLGGCFSITGAKERGTMVKFVIPTHFKS
jgi:signal transduction histidine kinase